jgi:hypothetical protein
VHAYDTCMHLCSDVQLQTSMVEGAGMIAREASMLLWISNFKFQASSFKFQGMFCSVPCALASVTVFCAEMSLGVSLKTREMLKLMLGRCLHRVPFGFLLAFLPLPPFPLSRLFVTQVFASYCIPTDEKRVQVYDQQPSHGAASWINDVRSL